MPINKSILIVDDVSDNIVLLQSILDKAGYNTIAATSGLQAVDLCKEIDLDLILLDVRMPQMDGFETAKQIQNNSKNAETPILFLLVKTDESNISNAFKNGGVDIINKPFNDEELLARINTHLTLRAQQNNLAQLNITKDKFLNILAHDLRNPFNSLLGFSELLHESIDQADLNKIKKYADIIQNTSKNTYDLLNNLLSWAQAQQQGIVVKKELVNLNELINELVQTFENAAESKNIEIFISLNEPIALWADREMLNTIIRNLLTNAIKYSKVGGEIKIKGVINNDFAEIRVKDNGIGMDETTKNSLFKVLETKSKKGTKGEIGTGFGLILCKEFVELQGGKIRVESQLEKGCEFIFTIPIKNN